MEFEGVVFAVLPLVTGQSARGQWMKQEVVFELPGEFSRKVCIGFWGDKAQDAGNLKAGEVVAVSANVESREYNGRWFTEARAWKMSRKAPQVQTGAHADLPPMDNFSPFDGNSSDEADDLPF